MAIFHRFFIHRLYHRFFLSSSSLRDLRAKRAYDKISIEIALMLAD